MKGSKSPNGQLAQLLQVHGISRKGLAKRVNLLGSQMGVEMAYKHTSVGNWLAGAIPRDPAPRLIAAALSERIGRPVELAEIGMHVPPDDRAPTGWPFHRDRDSAVRHVQQYWSPDNADERFRRAGGGFAVAGYASPVTRWLAVPRDPTCAHEGARRVGRNDLADLWDAAEQARRWDSKFGGGSWHSQSVTRCLQYQAVPLLSGTYSEEIGRELFSATAELSRVVAWSAFDSGHSDAAQQHFIQALRLARAGGDVEMGCYVLTTMALHTMLEGHPDQAADMAQGAYERAKGRAATRVLAFAKIVAARAFGRLGDVAAACAELRAAEALLERTDPGSQDPDWLRYLTPARLAAAATEIFRDLRRPAASLAWSRQAEAISPTFTRATGVHQAVVATVHVLDGDRDSALASGERAVSVLAELRSTLARRYLAEVATAFAPWTGDPRVRDFTRRLAETAPGK